MNTILESKIKNIIDSYPPQPDALVDMLTAINREFGYIPRQAMERAAQATNLPASTVYGAATFYSLFATSPRGRYIIRYCQSAPCHVVGATAVLAALERELGIAPGQTTEDGLFTLEPTSCLGLCGVGPVITIGDDLYGNLTPAAVPEILARYRQQVAGREAQIPGPESRPSIRDQGAAEARPFYRAHVLISTDSISLLKGATEVRAAFVEEISRQGLQNEVLVVETGMLGTEQECPTVLVYPEGTIYVAIRPGDVPEIVSEHLIKGRPVRRLLAKAPVVPGIVTRPTRISPVAGQERIVLDNCGQIDPERIEEYIAHNGYLALHKALTSMTPEEVIAQVKAAGLRGRGGAGFPTGLKWEITRRAATEHRDKAPEDEPHAYIVANADESEPGTFKDRLILEGDPFRLLEAMTIAGYAVGANEGYIYIRGEYAQAIERLERAIAKAREMGLLGQDIFGTGFAFDIHLHRGAGAYICGEETALLESMEGRRGEPRTRPPYPPTYGLWGKPTVVNNVETLANIPPIIRNGAAWFRRFGTERSPGTKVYTILGHVARPGLIEVPMGITLRQVIEAYGGGIPSGRPFKLAQTGGTAGSIIPASLLDVPMDYDSMAAAGASLGSGALLICDDSIDVVDLLQVLMRFFAYESCGKCVPCRLGTTRLLEMFTRLAQGRGQPGDLEAMEGLAQTLALASYCGLGQAAAVPVLSALRHFRDEIEAHLPG